MTPLERRKRFERKDFFVILVIVSVWVSIVFYKTHQLAPLQKQLEGEFNKIQPPTGSVAWEHIDNGGTETVLIESTYKTTQTFTAIKKHYEVELLRDGWTIKEEHNVSNGAGIWSYIAKIDFCKGPYAASLGYADALPEPNFYFNVSWGISSCQQ
jgi:hypothetical protein